MSTEQEKFWAGEFGNAYIGRNRGDAIVASNTALFARALARTGPISSVLEIGANIGLNLRALGHLLPQATLTGIEINALAVSELATVKGVEALHQSIHEFKPQRTYDLVLSKTVLIHIAPDRLPSVYDTMFAAAERYILLVEYYNPTPVTVSYRNHSERLFKRDFAGEMIDRYPGRLSLLDYGFWYHRDRYHQDDVTWFLLGKA